MIREFLLFLLQVKVNVRRVGRRGKGGKGCKDRGKGKGEGVKG